MSASSHNMLRAGLIWLALLHLLISSSVSAFDKFCRLDSIQNGKELFVNLHSINSVNEVWSGNLTENASGVSFLFGICRNTRSRIPQDFSPCRKDTPVCLELKVAGNHSTYLPLFRTSQIKSFELNQNSNPMLTFAPKNLTSMFIPKNKTLTSAFDLSKSKLANCGNATAFSSKIEYVCGTLSATIEWISANKVGENECELQFKWTNSFACPSSAFRNLTFVKENVYKDTEVGQDIDLNSFINHQGELKTKYSKNNDEYVYYVNPSKDLLANLKATNCNSSFICQYQNRTTSVFSREVATVNTLSVYKLSDELHLKFVSQNSKCGRTKTIEKNTTVIMRLLCGKEEQLTFNYESGLCDYIFNWESPKICKYYPNKYDEFEEIATQSPTQASKEQPNEGVKVISKQSSNPEPVSTKPLPSTKSPASLSGEIVIKTIVKTENHSDHHLSESSLFSEASDANARQKNRHIGLLLLVIIFVTSIFLAILLVIDDTKRMWFVTRVRRALNPNMSSNIRYSQVSNRNLEASKLVRLENVPDF